MLGLVTLRTTMVMESMNHKIDHPGMFLHTIPQAYAGLKKMFFGLILAC